MEIGDRVHWFVTSRCNLDCVYCFKPDDYHNEGPERLVTLAKILVKNNVKEVVIGGGEPGLVKDLDKGLRVLKDGGVYVSYHANGIGLNNKRIAELSELTDDIALPIDSVNESVQERLRGKKFTPILRNIQNLSEEILSKNIGIGYHTVFTTANYLDIPKIYKLINKRNFKYWRIYEFNTDLALRRLFNRGKHLEDDLKIEKLSNRINEVLSLRGHGTPEKGYTDCLSAYFLLMEEKMMKHNDERVQFVGIRDNPDHPYIFLENSGDIGFYCWFSGRERRVLSNILDEDFNSIKEKVKEVNEKTVDYDEKTHDEFVEAIWDRPVWQRWGDGVVDFEEIEEIDPKYHNKLLHLSRLYESRIEKIV